MDGEANDLNNFNWTYSWLMTMMPRKLGPLEIGWIRLREFLPCAVQIERGFGMCCDDDATYTVSGPQDHSREQMQGSGFLMERVPTYENLFSELNHHPSQSFRLRVDNKVPAHIDRNFHPLPTFNPDLASRSAACQVTGPHRYKFFTRQIYGGLATSSAIVSTLHALHETSTAPEVIQEEVLDCKTRTIAIQTDYRESECQTLPWDPEYCVPEKPSAKQEHRSSRFHCNGPEVLTLRHLTFGDGFPVGQKEINHIDKLRAKRAFEASLPSVNDLEKLHIRQQLIEEWEAREWAERNSEIAGLQAERLTFLKDAIEYREHKRDQEVQATVHARKERNVAAIEKTVASIEKERVKTVRHLNSLRKQAQVLWPKQKASLVHDYANYGSQKYAPLQRLGQFSDNRPTGRQIVTESFQPETIREVDDLEAYMKDHLKEIQVQGPSKQLLRGHQSRKNIEIHKVLGTISAKLEQAKKTHGLGHGDCWLSPIEETNEEPRTVAEAKVAARPRTPTVISEGDATNAAVVLLQRLLRGRAVQNYMFEGLQRREDLIKELKLEESQSAMPGEPGHPEKSSKMLEMDQILGSCISEYLQEMANFDTAGADEG